jgi:hypothetical protein
METELSTCRATIANLRGMRIIKSTYYERLKYLKSDPSKDAEGTYLNKAESAYIPTHPH